MTRKEYARFELDLIGFTEFSEGPKKIIRDKVLHIIEELGEETDERSDYLAACLSARLLKRCPLSSLTMESGEFSKDLKIDNNDPNPLESDLPFYENERYANVRKDEKGIYDIGSFIVKAEVQEEDGFPEKAKHLQKQIFIARPIVHEIISGIRTGRYFKKIYLNEDWLKENEYAITDPIQFPAFEIIFKDHPSQYEVEAKEIDELIDPKKFTIDWQY